MLDNPFISGAITGLIQNAFAHPLDTVKTYVQNNPNERINFRKINYFNGILFSSKISIITTSITFGVNYSQKDDNNYKTGFIAGIFNSITNPLEIQKIQRQMQIESRHILKLPLYKGFGATFLRETTANSIYFGSYHDLKNKIGIFQAGGIAGVSCWFLTYPIDVLKSRVQSSNISYLEAYRVGNIWSGLSYCLVRAYIGNAIGFSIYELIKKS